MTFKITSLFSAAGCDRSPVVYSIEVDVGGRRELVRINRDGYHRLLAAVEVGSADDPELPADAARVGPSRQHCRQPVSRQDRQSGGDDDDRIDLPPSAVDQVDDDQQFIGAGAWADVPASTQVRQPTSEYVDDDGLPTI